MPSYPPQTIIFVPDHTAVWTVLSVGELAVSVAVQVSVLGLYLPPVLNTFEIFPPPQTIISLPVHTAVCEYRAKGALVAVVAVQLSVLGLYLPPVLKSAMSSVPPQT